MPDEGAPGREAAGRARATDAAGSALGAEKGPVPAGPETPEPARSDAAGEPVAAAPGAGIGEDWAANAAPSARLRGFLARAPRGAPLRADPLLARVGAIGVPLLFFVAGLVVYGADLDHPDLLVLDEVHYVRSASHFANASWMNPAWSNVVLPELSIRWTRLDETHGFGSFVQTGNADQRSDFKAEVSNRGLSRQAVCAAGDRAAEPPAVYWVPQEACSGKVGAGALRLTPSVGAAGSRVGRDDPDRGARLRDADVSFRYTESNGDGRAGPGEGAYLAWGPTRRSAEVEAGWVRMVAFGNLTAGTVVAPGDPDAATTAASKGLPAEPAVNVLYWDRDANGAFGGDDVLYWLQGTTPGNAFDHRPWNFEHPPLGKWWMALSLHFAGDEESRLYRWPGVLYAAAGLAGLSVLGRRLFRSTAAGIVAPVLLFLDPMWFVHARTAILEIFVAAPMVWAFAFALGRRPWEAWGAAGAAGIALAGKYTALFLLPALLLVLLWRELDRRTPVRAAGRSLVLALAVPVVICFLASGPILLEWWSMRGPGYAVSQWLFVVKEGFSWGSVGPEGHPEHTPPLWWIPMVRPTWYYVLHGDGTGSGQVTSVVYAIGNPVVWWGGLLLAAAVLTLPLLRGLSSLRVATRGRPVGAFGVRARDWNLIAPMGFALALFATGYLPHFALDRDSFLYYMTFLVPYLALMAGGGLALGLAAASRWRPFALRGPEGHWWRGPVVAATGATLLVLAAAALWVWWTPLFTGYPVPRGRIDAAWGLLPWMARIL